jgi:hypothetical protein
LGQVIFAVTMIALGIVGLTNGDFTVIDAAGLKDFIKQSETRIVEDCAVMQESGPVYLSNSS